MGDPSVCCVEMYGIGQCPAAWASSPPPLSLSLYITRRSQVIVVVTQQNLEAKKKKTALPSFIRPFLSLAISFLWPRGVEFIRESVRRMLTLREIKLLKQRRKKSGPPYGVDFKRELTSSMLTSRGFHCITFAFVFAFVDGYYENGIFNKLSYTVDYR